MTELIGEITSLAFGGQGILRADGRVVFIPFCTPGDRVRVRVVKEHKRFAEGELLEVLSPSPNRIPPACPYFGRCGGCQLQHLQYAEQLKQKQGFVTDALERLGKILLPEPISITAAEPIWNYRRHIHLTLQAINGHYKAGYICVDGVTHLSVAQCPIFLPDELNFLQPVHDLIPVDGEAHLGIYKNGPRFILAYEFTKRLPPNLDIVAKRHLERYPQVQSVSVRCGNKTKAWGDIHGAFSLNGLTITFSPLAFVQNHAAQSANIYGRIAELAGNTVLDLYCGIGALSLLLAQKGARVTGIEGSAEAIRLATRNASQNNLNATFICDNVSKKIHDLLQQPWDTVIVNPPRTGLDPKTREALFKARPAQILYLSCMPATLARDLAAAQQAGYQIRSCHAYDMFPQTTHVETLVELARLT